MFSDYREAREPAFVEPEVDCGLRSAPASRLARIAQKFLSRTAAIIRTDKVSDEAPCRRTRPVRRGARGNATPSGRMMAALQ